MTIFIGVLFAVVCVLLIIVVLLQKGRGGGLGAAFGGAGSSAFGTRTGDVFTWVTIVLTSLFLLLAIVCTLLFRTPPGVVATPNLDPPAQAISEPIQVTVRCSTGAVKMAYTTDGSEPIKDNAQRKHILEVTVRPGQTLKVRAFRAKWKPSPIVSATYETRIIVSPATAPAAATQPAPTSQPN